jgi:ADP-ribosylglycohydrolase
LDKQAIIDMAAARGLAQTLDEDQASLLKLVLADDNMKSQFLNELDFWHGPRISQKSDDSVKLIGAMKYALGRSTSVPHTVVDEIKDHWQYFTSPEKQTIVETIEEAIHRNRAGMPIDADKWQEVIDQAGMESSPRP